MSKDFRGASEYCSEYSEDVSVILVSEMIYCVSRGMLNRAH